jgi:hypothetical protein
METQKTKELTGANEDQAGPTNSSGKTAPAEKK